MAEKKKQINIFIPLKMWQNFSKKCIDLDRSKTSVIKEIIKKFTDKK